MSGPRVTRNRREYRRLNAYNWLYSALVALVVTVLVFTVLFHGLRVSDLSMAPSLNKGDLLLLSRLSQVFSTPARGDVFAHYRGGSSGIYIGRVVALPGERVEIAGGKVYVNGVLLNEASYAPSASADMAELGLGAGEFFILPDTRPAMPFTGEDFAISYKLLLGRAALRVSPLNAVSLFVKSSGF